MFVKTSLLNLFLAAVTDLNTHVLFFFPFRSLSKVRMTCTTFKFLQSKVSSWLLFFPIVHYFGLIDWIIPVFFFQFFSKHSTFNQSHLQQRCPKCIDQFEKQHDRRKNSFGGRIKFELFRQSNPRPPKMAKRNDCHWNTQR